MSFKLTGTNVGEDTDFRGDMDGLAENKLVENRSKWTTCWPVYKRMEYEFTASVRVLLPSRKLVQNSQRHTFLEFTILI